MNAPQTVRADPGAQYGDPFLLSPEPEDRWVNAPRPVRAGPGAQYGDPFLLSPDPFLPSPEPEDRWVNAPRLVRADPRAQKGHHHLQFFQIPHNLRSKITHLVIFMVSYLQNPITYKLWEQNKRIINTLSRL